MPLSSLCRARARGGWVHTALHKTPLQLAAASENRSYPQLRTFTGFDSTPLPPSFVSLPLIPFPLHLLALVLARLRPHVKPDLLHRLARLVVNLAAQPRRAVTITRSALAVAAHATGACARVVMRRRWSRAAVVASLVLLASACLAESRAVPRTSEAGGAKAAACRRSAFDLVVVGLVSIGLGRRWRAGELVDEDKRRVPTGPNPLHNR